MSIPRPPSFTEQAKWELGWSLEMGGGSEACSALSPLSQGFSALVLLIFFVVGAVLCIVGCLAESQVDACSTSSTHSCDNQKMSPGIAKCLLGMGRRGQNHLWLRTTALSLIN